VTALGTRAVLDRIAGAIDAVSTATGWLAGWLIVPMTVAVFWEVVARYAFNAPTKWTYEAGWMLYGAQFMLAAAYTLLKGGHIRTDVLYERWSPRRRAIVDLVGYVFFFFPGLLLIFYAGAIESWHTWEIGERTGLRILGVSVPMAALKAVIPATAALLLLQGLSEVIRCARAMRPAPR
jgi:TRAP-type mannitol/chloroaromatic compound transport system permease small subunit